QLEVQMMRSRVGVVAFVAAVALAALAAAHASATATRSDHATAKAAVPAKKIGYVTIFGDPVQQRFRRVFEAAAKRVGWKVDFVDARGNPAQALRAMQNFINDGVDAIVASSVETAYVKTALDDARRKGIPTIAVGAIIGGNTSAWSAVYVESEAGLSQALAHYVTAQTPAAGKDH